jgi:hypothetical protein
MITQMRSDAMDAVARKKQFSLTCEMVLVQDASLSPDLTVNDSFLSPLLD